MKDKKTPNSTADIEFSVFAKFDDTKAISTTTEKRKRSSVTENRENPLNHRTATTVLTISSVTLMTHQPTTDDSQLAAEEA